MSGVTAQRDGFTGRAIAPATALVMLALQVASSAARDAFFLSTFPVTALPWFVAAAAAVSFPAARGAGSALARLGPGHAVPTVFGLSGTLFVVEAWLLPGHPASVAVVLYFHATVLGAIAISTFWSLLDERFDPHTAKRVFSRVAGAASLGAVLGGLGAERIAAVHSPRAVLGVLAVAAAACVAGVLAVARGRGRRGDSDERVRPAGDGTRANHAPYLRAVAAIATLAALVGTLCDYVLKADVAAHVAGGVPLIRFFGLFYAATGITAFVIQFTVGQATLKRLKITGTLAVHPLAVGTAGLVALVAPAPWRGVLLRSADVTVRHSIFRTGYELLYTPLPETTRRSAKATIDVGWDCIGNGLGAAVVFLLTRLVPALDVTAVTLAAMAAAGAELAGARRLRSGYVSAVEERFRERLAGLPRVTHYTFNPVTMARLASLDSGGGGWSVARDSPPLEDPVVAALSALRSDDPVRARQSLRLAEREPLLVGAVIALLGREELMYDAAATLRAHGARVAGQLADALVDPRTPEVVRRRLPLVLKSLVSRRAFDGLVEGLGDPSLTVRVRCCRALLELAAAHPTLRVPREIACAAAERELDADTADERSIVHVFDLLALAFDRAMIAIARRACETGRAQAEGTALAYLETTLPPTLFAKLERRMAERPAANGC